MPENHSMRKPHVASSRYRALVFTSKEEGTIFCGIVFSRLSYEQDDRAVFVLAPSPLRSISKGRASGRHC
jgi:hypothetical protein